MECVRLESNEFDQIDLMPELIEEEEIIDAESIEDQPVSLRLFEFT